jgi:hypothetical protein
MWLTAATLHLEGDAAHWFQSYKLKHTVQGWPDFITAVEAKFGVHDYRQFMDDLLALKQGGSVARKLQLFPGVSVQDFQPQSTLRRGILCLPVFEGS